MGRRGGSLEQIIGSVDDVKAAVEEGGLVNMYWIGRVNEATIRHDSDIEDYIANEADAWLTTWVRHGPIGQKADATNSTIQYHLRMVIMS